MARVPHSRLRFDVLQRIHEMKRILHGHFLKSKKKNSSGMKYKTCGEVQQAKKNQLILKHPS